MDVSTACIKEFAEDLGDSKINSFCLVLIIIVPMCSIDVLATCPIKNLSSSKLIGQILSRQILVFLPNKFNITQLSD